MGLGTTWLKRTVKPNQKVTKSVTLKPLKLKMSHHQSESSSGQIQNESLDDTLGKADDHAFDGQDDRQEGGDRVYLHQPDVSFASLAEAKRQLIEGIAGSKWRYNNRSSTTDCEKIWY